MSKMTDNAGKPFTVKDANAWTEWFNRNADPYGRAALNYAARWMALMEADANATSVANMLTIRAKEHSHTADTEGITGYMHGAAAKTIAQHWTHGEAFRRWFNGDVQIGTEGDEANKSGGILNPALLSVR